ncbi:hypothetical protein MPH_08665 [Macrophomina phaseolina MS6]|uniref:Uncharacterized protein n=1 Tax=Macrophomina phaseolina (strain MS6) TaxID=1126212 RepID=K2RMX4_MACPH|nr:hypothetical protein MPH_08665 [Macrophomina phaseolina MS6]
MGFLGGFGVSAADKWIQLWNEFNAWLSTTCAYWTLIAWVITFTVLMFIGLSLGFGPAGILPRSAAAAFQSFVYGGFIPAGGVFATLTSLAMQGYLAPAMAMIAGILASIIAAIVWNTF